MEWVETTGKTLAEAQERALDQLGVAADEAEFEVLEEPRAGLFGRVRGEARVRARVKPAAVRPKQDRRARGRSRAKAEAGSREPGGDAGADRDETERAHTRAEDVSAAQAAPEARREGRRDGRARERRTDESKPKKETATMETEAEQPESTVTPQEVGDAAVAFMSGLATAFGVESTTTLELEGTELDVRTDGDGLGLLVGPGGRTLLAIQDLARVASQRRLGDHETRLRIDVAGYREKRREALERFAQAVAEQVIETGAPKALEPMASADRKVVHDALAVIDGVTSRSDGEDPMRRVVISPA